MDKHGYTFNRIKDVFNSVINMYEMGGWKELKMERRFDNQKDAYKYFASLRNLNWE